MIKILESCYEINFSKIGFIERKVKITNKKTIILGPPKTGKSFLIYDFLSNFKNEEYLYIDFYDFRNDVKIFKNELEEFIKKNNILILVLENFNFQISIPECENIILSSTKKIKIDNFNYINLNSLDFEEYLLHDSKYQNITQSFNNYFKYGNIPEIVNTDDFKKINNLQNIVNTFCKDDIELEIFKILVDNIDEKKSLIQIFRQLKLKIKISKDRFYDTCKNLEENKIIYFISKYKQEKSVKKIFCYNFSYIKALTHTKKFKNEFSNMVFLELLNKYNQIYYIDNIDFYVESKNIGILSVPFFNSSTNNILIKKIVKIATEFKIKDIQIITISNSQIITDSNIKINVIPFYEWALS